MQIITQCPYCGNSWLLEEEAADRRIRCAKCRQLFSVPKLEDVPKAAKIIKRSKHTLYVDKDGKTYG